MRRCAQDTALLPIPMPLLSSLCYRHLYRLVQSERETGCKHGVTTASGTAGMALDLTATDVVVPHPDPDLDPLPPMPLLFLMTADYKLEAWSIISTGESYDVGF